MSDPQDKEALGVFKDRQRAEAAAERARAAGVADSGIRVGDDADERASLLAEMQDEMEESWISPQAAFAATKEAAKGMSLLVPVAGALGVLITLPFAFIFTFGGASLWLRLVIAVATGALGGGTVGFIIGGGMATKGPDEPLAAEKGVTVRVAHANDQVVDELRHEEPIRLDAVAPDGPKTSTVETEEQRTPDGLAEDLAQSAHQPEGDWSRTRSGERRSSEQGGN